MKIFATRFRELRKEKELSQVALAQVLGISQKTLSDYERNYYEPTQEMLVKIARYFGVTVGYLLGEEDY